MNSVKIKNKTQAYLSSFNINEDLLAGVEVCNVLLLFLFDLFVIFNDRYLHWN